MSLMSMTIDYKVNPLFTTPLFVFSDFITEEERVKIYHSIKKVNHFPHKAITGNATSTHGQKVVDFLDREITDRIQSALDECNDEYGGFSTKLDLIWSNIQMKGSVLTEHTHPDSSLSGALYINANDGLFFHNPNPYVYFTSKNKSTIFNCEYAKFPVKNCQLLIFPSWLRHGKNDLINEMDDRVVVSFNATSK